MLATKGTDVKTRETNGGDLQKPHITVLQHIRTIVPP